jgi:peptidyl-prolyl cis-trans isomerase D
LRLQTPSPFAENETIPGLGSNHPLARAAFQTNAGEVGPVLSHQSEFVIFKVLERTPSFVPPLESIREKVAAAAKQAKARELAKQKAEALLEQAKNASLRVAAEGQGLQLEETPPFTRDGAFIPKIGDSAQLKEVAFTLSPEQPLAPSVYAVGDTFVVAALLERIEPSDEEFSARKEQLLQQALAQRRSHVLEEFTNYLQSKAQIDLHTVQVASASGSRRR